MRAQIGRFLVCFSVVVLCVGLSLRHGVQEALAQSGQAVFETRAERTQFFRLIRSPETRVIAIVAEWCGACRNLEAELQREQIRYTRVDIDRSEPGRELFERLAGMTGSRGIPKVIVDSFMVQGGVPGIREALKSKSGREDESAGTLSRTAF